MARTLLISQDLNSLLITAMYTYTFQHKINCHGNTHIKQQNIAATRFTNSLSNLSYGNRISIINELIRFGSLEYSEVSYSSSFFVRSWVYEQPWFRL